MDFPMSQIKVNGKQLVYFDSAATNHKPQVVIDWLTELYTKQYGSSAKW
jgi:cysteine desulfurase/selenocysteine lyase